MLYGLYRSHLNLHVACLVRNTSKAQQAQLAYPDAEIIEGSLDDTDLVKQEAQASDIVLSKFRMRDLRDLQLMCNMNFTTNQTNTDLAATCHTASASAIATGLNARRTRASTPAYWIQMSGATVYAAEEIATGRYGYESNRSYDDLKDLEQILLLIRSNPKRIVENTVLSQDPSCIKTALIIGPLIYGTGTGL